MRKIQNLAWLGVFVTAVLTGCASTDTKRPKAPIEDRAMTGPNIGTAQNGPTAPSAAVAAQSTWTVRPGDTLMAISRATGLPWQDIARWNNLANASQLRVGQTLQLTPAGGAAAPNVAPGVQTYPVSPSGGAISSATTGGATTVPLASVESAWVWPANGSVVGRFEEGRTKGIKIAGQMGDPVVASNDGRVVFAGPFKSYGNMVIIKHIDGTITAYGHNQTLAVQEDQAVKRGQKIATMGNSDAERVQLHFEMRKANQAVDPLRYLPAK